MHSQSNQTASLHTLYIFCEAQPLRYHFISTSSWTCNEEMLLLSAVSSKKQLPNFMQTIVTYVCKQVDDVLGDFD